MNYQLTRHLEVSPDEADGPFGSDQFLLSNQVIGTRMLADSAVWDFLKNYEQPRALEETPLIQRAAAAQVLVPEGRPPEGSALLEEFLETARKILRYRKVEPADSVPELLKQLESACTPLGEFDADGHYMWSDPKKLFGAMLENFGIYYESELCGSQSGVVLTDFAKQCLGRPQRNGNFAQQLCTMATSVARAQSIWARFPEGAQLLTLGDDDLMSLVLTQKPGYEVTVFEIDLALVRFIRKRKNEQVHLHKRDLSNGLPEEFRGRYDVALADPPYNIEGMSWFMDCSLQALKRGSSRLYLSTCPPLLESPEHLFRQLEAGGLKVEETHHNFNRYPFPEETHSITTKGLLELGYHPSLVEVLMKVPYLYAHLYECTWQ